MPIIWIDFPTGSSPEVHRRRNRPTALRKLVSEIVSKADHEAELIELYFAAGADRAYALVRCLDNYVALKSVTGVLGAEHVTKLLLPEDAEEAIKRGRTLIPKRKGSSTRRRSSSAE